RGTGVGRPRRPRPHPPVRAGHPELRPVHLLRDPFPRPAGGPVVSILLVGLGHPDRGDDAVGSTVLWSLAAEGGVDADGPGDDVRILVLVDPVDLPLR